MSQRSYLKEKYFLYVFNKPKNYCLNSSTLVKQPFERRGRVQKLKTILSGCGCTIIRSWSYIRYHEQQHFFFCKRRHQRGKKRTNDTIQQPPRICNNGDSSLTWTWNKPPSVHKCGLFTLSTLATYEAWHPHCLSYAHGCHYYNGTIIFINLTSWKSKLSVLGEVSMYLYKKTSFGKLLKFRFFSIAHVIKVRVLTDRQNF